VSSLVQRASESDTLEYLQDHMAKKKAPMVSWLTALSRVVWWMAMRARRMLGVSAFWGFLAGSWLVYPFSCHCKM
jgi:hypothetical protein